MAADAVANDAWWRRGAREAPGLAAIAVVVLAVFWPLANLRTLLVTPEGATRVSDMFNGSYPQRLLSSHALANGHLPLWTDQIYCGYPLFACPAVGTYYPPNWLFIFLPGPAAMSLLILLTCMTAGWFTYYYCRTLGLGRAAATLAGMSFAVCGFFASHAKHVALSASACWLPLELALAERACGRGRAGVRAALWLAPVVALQCLAGGLQFVYISALGVAVYALIRLAGREARRPLAACATSPRSPFGKVGARHALPLRAGSDRAAGDRAPTPPLWRRLGEYALLGVAIAWGLALAAPQLLPSRELSRVSERAAGMAPGAADPHPLPVRDLLTLVSADAVGRATDNSYYQTNPQMGVFWEDYIYAGWPVVVLALVGLPWALRRRPPARALLVLGVAGIVLALGERGGLFPIAFKVIPGMKLFRFPQRFLLWTEMATAVLGAMGAEMVFARLRGRSQAVLAGILLAVTAVDLAVAQSKQNVYYPARHWLTPPATVAAVRKGQTAGLQPRTATVTSPAENIHYALLITDGGWEAHLDDLLADRAFLAPSSNAIWGVPLTAGYMELVPQWTAKIWGGQQTYGLLRGLEEEMIQGLQSGRSVAKPPAGYLELLGAANVRYIISRWPLVDRRLREIPLPIGCYMYRNPEALGRAYLVPRAEDIGSDDEFLALAQRGKADLRHRVYLYGRESQAQADFSAIPVRARDNATLTRVTLEPRAPAPCWLVLSDSYYPGWSVTVDGKPAALERANCVMRAVRLSAGRHRVEFSYRCRLLEVGYAVAAVSAVLWLLALFLLPPRGRPEPG